jgi:outer membrane protein assembly factor BamB
MALKWRARIGGRLSQPVIDAYGTYVAQVDAHTIYQLNPSTGKSTWSYTAGGRIDSPPALHEGRLVFGSRDGYVCCLHADTGEQRWRFRAAPERHQAVAFEQLESLWPVHGSVLVKDGMCYVAAGRSSYLDGGISIYACGLRDGTVRHSAELKSTHAGAAVPPSEQERQRMDERFSQNNTDYKTFLADDHSDAFSMSGALTDVMSASENSIFMRHLHLDRQLEQKAEKVTHLFSTSSLLDDTEHHRSFWVLGTGDFSRTPVAFPWIVRKKMAVPYGLMLCFDDQTVWGVRRQTDGKPQSYVAFAAERADAETGLSDFTPRAKAKPGGDLLWTAPLSKRPRAMLRAHEKLFIAGQDTQSDEEIGYVQCLSSDTGQLLGEWPLPAPAVWDGMAAAYGRLYVSLENGELVCLESGSQRFDHRHCSRNTLALLRQSPFQHAAGEVGLQLDFDTQCRRLDGLEFHGIETVPFHSVR